MAAGWHASFMVAAASTSRVWRMPLGWAIQITSAIAGQAPRAGSRNICGGTGNTPVIAIFWHAVLIRS